IPDETGQLKFELLMTNDGQSWTHIPATQLPPALEGEGAFAASNTCLAILPTLVIPSEARDPGPPNATPRADASDIPQTQPGPAQPGPAQPWKSGASAPRQPSEKDGASAPDPNIWFATGG